MCLHITIANLVYMACRGKSTIKNIVSMSKERQCKCTCPAHSLQHPDPRSHIPEMATPGNSLFPGTSCNKLPSSASFNMSCLGASLSCSATGSFRIDSNSCFHPAGLPQSDNHSLIESIKTSGRASALRLQMQNAMQVSNRCRFAKVALRSLAPHRPA